MRVKSARIDQVGPYHGTTLDFSTFGLNVLYGPNEAGKTSLLAALRGALFGQVHLAEGGPSLDTGAHVILRLAQEDGSLLTLERSLARRRPPRLTFADGTQATGQAELVRAFPELASVEQVLYETFFTVQLADLVAFSNAPSTLASQLFGLQAPLINPYALENDLEKRAKEIYNPSKRASKPVLNALQRKQAELTRQLRESHDHAKWYRQTVNTKHALTLKLTELTQEMKQVDIAYRFVCSSLQLWDTVLAFVELEQALAALGACPTGAFSLWSEAAVWLVELEQAAVLEKEQNAQLAAMNEQLEALSTPAFWIDVRGDLETWNQRLTRMEYVLTEWREMQQAVDEAERELMRVRGEVPGTWTNEQILSFGGRDELPAGLFEAAQAWETQVREVQDAKQQLDFATAWEQQQKQQAEDYCAAQRANRPLETPKDAMQALYQQMSTIKERREAVQRDAQRVTDWLADVPSLAGNAGGVAKANMGVPGAAVLLLGAGAAVETFQRDWLLVSGFLTAALALLAWLLWQQSRHVRSSVQKQHPTPRLSTIRWQDWSEEGARSLLERLQQQVHTSTDELHEVDHALASVSSWRDALAQRRLRETELEALQRHLLSYEQTYKASLAQHGSSGMLWTTAQLRQTSEACRMYVRWRDKRDLARRKMDEAQQAWTGFSEAFAEWLRKQAQPPFDLGLMDGALVTPDVSEVAVDTLAQLHAHVHQWMELAEKALQESMRRQSLQANLAHLQTAIDNRCLVEVELREKITSVFRQLNVSDEQAFQQVLEREEKRLDLHKSLETVRNRLLSACASERFAARVVAHVKSNSHRVIQLEQTSLQNKLERLEAEVKETQEALWQVNHALTTSETSQDGASLRWQIAQLSGQAEGLKQSFAALTLARALSRAARRLVEARENSPVFTNASELLSLITHGKYRRIGVPLSSDGLQNLYVIDSFSQSWALNRLSRGTREQIFLALRLAVIRQYRTQGVILPVILDDPLVNFDDDRTEQMLEVLAMEAEQQPIIYLTCHKRFLKDRFQSKVVHNVSIVNESEELV